MTSGLEYCKRVLLWNSRIFHFGWTLSLTTTHNKLCWFYSLEPPCIKTVRSSKYERNNLTFSSFGDLNTSEANQTANTGLKSHKNKPSPVSVGMFGSSDLEADSLLMVHYWWYFRSWFSEFMVIRNTPLMSEFQVEKTEEPQRQEFTIQYGTNVVFL